MSVRVYICSDEVHNRALKAFYDGCPEPKELCWVEAYEPSDVAVVFGVYKSRVPASFHRGKVIASQKAKGLTTVVLETGYINRGDGPEHHYAVGLNGLNGRADFKNENSPTDRAQALGVELKPWKEGENILLCGQVPWDASVDHIDFVDWLIKAKATIRYYTKREIVFRPHPKAVLPPFGDCSYSRRPLLEDLKDAHCVVTFNSNSAVEAVIEGTPVFAFDKGSMATKVANNSFEDIEHPKRPDRVQWLSDLAFAQWTLDEMREGKAWEHINPLEHEQSK